MSRHIKTSLMVVVVALTFLPVLHNDFVACWDDGPYVVNNEIIQDVSLTKLKKIWTTPYFSNYHPVTTTLYMVQYHFFGLHAGAYHAASVLLHLLNCLLVLWFVFLVARHFHMALFVALCFGLHPMHVESVAWISEQKDVLYVFFYLSSLISFVFYRSSQRPRFLWLSFFLFVFSLLSKAAALTLPFVIVLTDWYLFRKSLWRSGAVKILYFIPALAAGVVVMLTQVVPQLDTTGGLVTHTRLVQGFFTGAYALWFYLSRVFMPLPLSAMHFYPDDLYSLPWLYYAAPAMLALIVWGCFKINVRRREVAFGALFFLFTIIFFIRPVPYGDTFAAERYTYLSYIGIFFIAGTFFFRSSFFRRHKILLYLMLSAYLVFLGITSLHRTLQWKDGITLFSDVIQKYPGHHKAYVIRGNAKYMQADYAGALADYDKAVTLYSHYPKAYNNRGDIKRIMGDFRGALSDYSRAIKLDSSYFLAYMNRGYTYQLMDMPEAAWKDYNLASRIKPEHPVLSYNRALIWLGRGNKEKACSLLYQSAGAGHAKAEQLLYQYECEHVSD